MRKRRKATVKAVRTRKPLTRRQLMGTLAVSAGALAVGGAARANEDEFPESQLPQWVSWDDGFAYPVHDIAEDGEWIVKFDDGFFLVDPAGFVCDSGVWYAVTGWDPTDGFWFAGDDDYEYALVSEIVLETIDQGDLI